MTLTNNIPTDTKGDVMWGNPDRMGEIAKQLADASGVLAPQAQELLDCREFMRYGDSAPAHISVHGEDADIARLVEHAAPPRFGSRAETVDKLVTAVRATAKSCAVNAWTIAGYSNDLAGADASFRDAMLRVGTRSAMIAYAAVDGFAHTYRGSYDTARDAIVKQGLLGQDDRMTDHNLHDDLTTFFKGIEATATACPTPVTVAGITQRVGNLLSGSDGGSGKSFMEQHPWVTGLGLVGVPGGAGAGYLIEHGAAGWYGRQLQDNYGGVFRQLSNDGILIGRQVSTNAHFIGGTAANVAELSVGNTQAVGGLLTDQVHNAADFLTGKQTLPEFLHNDLAADWHAGSEIAGNLGTYATNQASNLKEFATSTGSNLGHYAGATFDTVKDALNPFD